MEDSEFLQITSGTNLLIKFSPAANTGGLVAIIIAVLFTQKQGNQFIVKSWFNSFLGEQCELVFDRTKQEWIIYTRVGENLYEIPVEDVVVLKEGPVDNREIENISL